MNIKLSFISIAFLSLSFNVAANEFEKSQEHYKSVTDLKKQNRNTRVRKENNRAEWRDSQCKNAKNR